MRLKKDHARREQGSARDRSEAEQKRAGRGLGWRSTGS
jgi:hypothetical protein